MTHAKSPHGKKIKAFGKKCGELGNLLFISRIEAIPGLETGDEL